MQNDYLFAILTLTERLTTMEMIGPGQRRHLDCLVQSARMGSGGNAMPIELPLNTMSVEEKVQLLEQVWDNLCRQSGDVRSPEWHAVILNERKKQIENGTMAVSPWAEAKERLQKLGK